MQLGRKPLLAMFTVGKPLRNYILAVAQLIILVSWGVCLETNGVKVRYLNTTGEIFSMYTLKGVATVENSNCIEGGSNRVYSSTVATGLNQFEKEKLNKGENTTCSLFPVKTNTQENGNPLCNAWVFNRGTTII